MLRRLWSQPARERTPEARRRRREAWVIAATAIAVLGFALFEILAPQSTGAGSTAIDVMLVGLINLNLILLVLLVFLVGRNIVKLLFERRRRLMGSHLRTKLVGAFFAIACLPAALMFAVAFAFVGNSIERWFNGQVETSLEGSLEVAHAYYQDLAGSSLGFARQVAARVGAEGLVVPARRAALQKFLDEHRKEYQLDMLEVFGRGNQVRARSRRPDLPGGIGIDAGSSLLKRGAGGLETTAVEAVGEADMIRAAVPILVADRQVGVVVVGSYVPKSVVQRREQIDQAFGEYLRLKIQRRPIQTAYTITLVLVTVVVLFGALWLGIYMARGITVPIQRLAEGTRAVAQGDLDLRIQGEGDDEIGTLVRSFNRMTEDLKRSATELDARRRYLETLLANITAGVISTDAAGRITTMNRAAEALLGMAAGACVGQPLGTVCAGDELADVRQLAEQLREEVPATAGYTITVGAPVCLIERQGNGGRGSAPVERQMKLTRNGHEAAVLLTGTRLLDESGSPRGLVLFLEDVTHFQRVQRMEAWREVARRIAHEIKNPLTPIQLSAQRLRRRYAAQLGDGGAVFDECTRTIIQQVDELKTLVNEFATFARMPAGDHTPQDLNALIDEALVLFREGHREIDFVFTPGIDLPIVDLDREGIKRAVINILDNAVAACASRRLAPPGERGQVELRTTFSPGLNVVRLEIADTGDGMTAEVKARLFEPYFSTKPDGTGLGLAIVSAIVADHNGFLRVRDNVPRGSQFVMEFPVRRQGAPLAVGSQREAAAGA